MTLLIFLVVLLSSLPLYATPPSEPQLGVDTQSTQVNLSWNASETALGYELFYAPSPYTGEQSIDSINLEKQTSFSVQLWPGAAYFVALKSYNDSGFSQFSNIELIEISGISKSLPANIVMLPITGGTFTMGNNDLLGPQAGQAVEHQVTLSNYELSETEISNAQYVEFLNAAYADGLIEIKIGSSGADQGKTLIVGSSRSEYAERVLYELSGTRVMKDHDNADGDNDPFTGSIEPENPLNIAFIGFNSETEQFYVKDPHLLSDFNWLELSYYYNYGSQTHSLDKSLLLNDFDNWSELSGWSEDNPLAATQLPTYSQVVDFPVTFIRWWGARAFADYYDVKLPTEAQWEYAAKAGQNNFFYAVYDGSSVEDANWNSLTLNPALHHVREVKSGQTNPFGLYNLGGNVWEWMADNYQAYDNAAVTDPLVEVSGSSTRAWRGGSWNYHQATLESSGRYYDDEDRGNDHFGFRVAR